MVFRFFRYWQLVWNFDIPVAIYNWNGNCKTVSIQAIIHISHFFFKLEVSFISSSDMLILISPLAMIGRMWLLCRTFRGRLECAWCQFFIISLVIGWPSLFWQRLRLRFSCSFRSKFFIFYSFYLWALFQLSKENKHLIMLFDLNSYRIDCNLIFYSSKLFIIANAKYRNCIVLELLSELLCKVHKKIHSNRNRILC